MTTTTYEPGKLYIGLLEQSTYWIDKEGKRSELTELGDRHLSCLEPFLLKYGERLRWSWFKMVAGRMPTDDGGNLDAGFEEWSDYEMDRPLAEWLADRPLVKAIRAELERR